MTTVGPIFYPSSPTEIRDGTVARLRAMPAFKNVFRQRTFPTKDAQVPLAAVWTARDNAAPNGDANAGSPSFLHNFTLAIDIVAAGADDDSLDATITGMAEGVRDTLLTDPTWVSLFEGIERCNLHYSYPKETDLILAMAVLEIEVTFRSDWPPVEINDLRTVAVTVEPRPAQATCRCCGTENEPGAAACGVCGSWLPVTSLTVDFDLEEQP